MSRPPKTPQEKKALSLKKDRRNAYGENDKSSRKNIPLQKALDQRKNRHRQNQALASVERLDEARAEVIESTARQDIRHGNDWKKSPDQPLGEHVSWALEKRAANVGAKLRRAEQQGRIPERLKAAPKTAP